MARSSGKRAPEFPEPTSENGSDALRDLAGGCGDGEAIAHARLIRNNGVGQVLDSAYPLDPEDSDDSSNEITRGIRFINQFVSAKAKQPL